MQTAERQITLLALITAYSHVQSSGNLNVECKEAVHLFRNSQQILKNGGAVQGFQNNFVIPAAYDGTELIIIKKLTKILYALNQNIENSQQEGSIQEQRTLVDLLKSQSQALLDYYQHQQVELQHYKFVFIMAACGFLTILLYLHWLFFKIYIYKPSLQLLKATGLAASGNLTYLTNYKAGDELGKTAQALDGIIENRLSLSAFAASIGDGNFKSDVTFQKSDKLAMSLLTMQDKLAKVASEDKKRNWAIEGLAKFGEILRSCFKTYLRRLIIKGSIARYGIATVYWRNFSGSHSFFL